MTSLTTPIQLIEVTKRDGSRVLFDPKKIQHAIENAFRDVYQIGSNEKMSEDIQDICRQIAERASVNALQLANETHHLEIENIQDIVEQQIMEAGQYSVARSYILYREEHKRARALKEAAAAPIIHITDRDGSRKPLDIPRMRQILLRASRGLEGQCSATEVLNEAILHLYEGIKIHEVLQALILAARTKIEKHPAYAFFTARLLLQKIYEEAFDLNLFQEKKKDLLINLEEIYRANFSSYIRFGIEQKRLSPDLLEFDLDALAQKLAPSRDNLFQYFGLQVLYDRYLIHHQQQRVEVPQYFWMRVSMGLALREKEKEKRASEFYDVLSQFLYVASTPTLFNAGTCHPQLSSCYLSTIEDDLDHIFKVIRDNARLSKWAGGLGNDWTNVRARGAMIKGTNGLTQGVIPFLKVANDTAIAVNQGGKRKGAVCAYLEVWHLDIEDFLELRKNTGDDRRRTHDMNTANWIPDLFMQRVKRKESWTLFNPKDVPDLHDLYGQAFAERYAEYEKQAFEGKMPQFKSVSAFDLWRKMLTMLFETGHPWITFKDPCNIRSPQSHTGVVHSSNLCTEITLNSSSEETAVCNLGSLNLDAFINLEGSKPVFNKPLLQQTIRTALRMLDNVIDINFYPTPEAAYSNQLHRPVGLGVMGFQDALYKLRVSYDSTDAVELADRSMELISYYAILASSELAQERGAYPSFKGSKWDQGLLPLDTIDLLEKERGEKIDMDRSAHLDWTPVRESIRQHGMRNSNTMAIAPTATIAHIAGVSPSLEPTYANLFSRSNLSGEFLSLNSYLIKDLLERKLWDADLLEELKHYDGSIQDIKRIPDDLKNIYRTAFEIDPFWLIECASRRQKWIDMSQSLNIYVKAPTGKKLSDVYFFAWEKGLKTTYYLRSLAATQVEKSTVDINKMGIQPRWMKNRSASSKIQIEDQVPKSCLIDDPGCESCQ